MVLVFELTVVVMPETVELVFALITAAKEVEAFRIDELVFELTAVVTPETSVALANEPESSVASESRRVA